MKHLTFGIALVFLSAAAVASSQEPVAAAPIQKMPFSPVLDLTSLDRGVRSLQRLLQVFVWRLAEE